MHNSQVDAIVGETGCIASSRDDVYESASFLSRYCFAHNIEGMGFVGSTYLHSFSALTCQTPYVTARIPANAIAVLAFQFDGRVHQPPAGDQTSLGYGYLPPPPFMIHVN